jgi:hypothetical protein
VLSNFNKPSFSWMRTQVVLPDEAQCGTYAEGSKRLHYGCGYFNPMNEEVQKRMAAAGRNLEDCIRPASVKCDYCDEQGRPIAAQLKRSLY